MSQYKIIKDGEPKEYDSKEEWEDMKQLLDENDVDYTAESPDTETDGGPEADVIDQTDDTADSEPVPAQPTAEPETVGRDIEQLSQNPIQFLRSVNSDFVNTIKGTPAISKQGFRFIQREFGITTEAKVVETFDDPLGVIVWAKATLPDGHSAEAHGEGWQFETKVDDNEFVRYGDTRAKNRALSDLTSAGALAVSELTGQE
jgi:hypothetical protein